ncbi:hypothetical protein AZH46_02395 [Corynebacterium striatum]|nr:hypothetical protein AZH46_02395 [Corynebacterium striatum]
MAQNTRLKCSFIWNCSSDFRLDLDLFEFINSQCLPPHVDCEIIKLEEVRHVINHQSNKQFRIAKLVEKMLTHQLVDKYSSIEGQPITRRDLRDLASMGCLTLEERELYDELRRVEMMLDLDE